MKVLLLVVLFSVMGPSSCADSSDTIQSEEQERILKEGTAAIGMPSIHNFRERRLVKDILELRDQTTLITYTYTFAEGSGKLSFFCDSIGYAVPYATQYTNPMKITSSGGSGYHELPQADPNGLFSLDSAEGSWVMCKDPNGAEVRPVYLEPRIVVSPFKLAI